MDIMVVFQTMLKLFLLLILGFVLFKCHIFDEYTNKKISALIVNVASPMLIISSIAGVEGNEKSNDRGGYFNVHRIYYSWKDYKSYLPIS